MFDDGALENKICAAPLDRGRFPIKCHQFLAAAMTAGNKLFGNHLPVGLGGGSRCSDKAVAGAA